MKLRADTRTGSRRTWRGRVLCRATFAASLVAVIASVGCGAAAPTPTTPTAPVTGSGSTPDTTDGATPGVADDATDGATGGATDGAASPGDPEVVDLEPMRIEVVPGGDPDNPELVSYDARKLLDDGNEALAEGRNDDAIAIYAKLLGVFPNSRLAPAAAYNTGLAYEAKGEYDAALDHFRRLADRRTLGRDSIDAHLRLGAVQAELERWAASQRTFEDVLSRDDLTHADRIEATARLGFAVLEQGDYAAAELLFNDALDHYDKLTIPLESDYFVGMSRYYKAQIPHRQFQAIPMRLPDEQLAKDLDAKTDLVKLAYDRYVEVLAVQDVYWATAAGYQLSQIYKEFWDDIVLAPVPPQLSPAAAEQYVIEVHKQVLIFLQRAVEGHTKNVELADAYQTSTVWSDASRVRVAEISQILARESNGELVTPEQEPRAQTPEPGARRISPGQYVPGRVDL